MKILHVIEPLRAGVLTALEILVQNTPHLEHSIAYDSSRSEPYDYLENALPGVKLIPMSLARTPSARKYFSSLTELIKLIKNSNFEIVHCHSSMAGLWGRLAAFYCRVPAFYTPHSFAFLRTDVSKLRKSAFWLAEYLLCPMCHTLLACGQDEYEEAQKLLCGKSRARIMKNSLDVSRLSEVPTHTPRERLLVGTSGRISPQKAPDIFSNIALSLQTEMDWTWIGAMDDDPFLPPHVERTGWGTREASLKYVGALDVYIQTSRWEGLSYALLEAMALGKPVVVSDIPANADLIKQGITGFLCKDEQEYISCLKELAQDANLRERMGKAAKEYVYAEHNAKVNYTQLSVLYGQATHKN